MKVRYLERVSASVSAAAAVGVKAKGERMKAGAAAGRREIEAEEDREEGEMLSDDIMLRERYRKTVIKLGLKCRPGLPTGRPTVAIGNHDEQMELDVKKWLW
jgi:hypothetical protein